MQDWIEKIKLFFNIVARLNKKLAIAQLKVMALTRDMEIDSNSIANLQLSADIFMQALMNTLDDEQIRAFFNESDKLGAKNITLTEKGIIYHA